MKILLTGDDGYKSLGIRTIVSILKDEHQLHIAATKTQQSATGGGVSEKGEWGEDIVDGIKALWLDAPPATAMDAVEDYFNTTYDLIISGINSGPNVGSGNASGTLGSAIRGLGRGLAPKALAFSWNSHAKDWQADSTKTSLDYWQDHVAASAKTVFELAIFHNSWGADLLNINLPREPNGKVRFCQPIRNEMQNYYAFGANLKNDGTFDYWMKPVVASSTDLTYDANALEAGYITIVPWLSNLYLNKDLLSLVGKELTI